MRLMRCLGSWTLDEFTTYVGASLAQHTNLHAATEHIQLAALKHDIPWPFFESSSMHKELTPAASLSDLRSILTRLAMRVCDRAPNQYTLLTHVKGPFST